MCQPPVSSDSAAQLWDHSWAAAVAFLHGQDTKGRRPETTRPGCQRPQRKDNFLRPKTNSWEGVAGRVPRRFQLPTPGIRAEGAPEGTESSKEGKQQDWEAWRGKGDGPGPASNVDRMAVSNETVCTQNVISPCPLWPRRGMKRAGLVSQASLLGKGAWRSQADPESGALLSTPPPARGARDPTPLLRGPGDWGHSPT